MISVAICGCTFDSGGGYSSASDSASKTSTSDESSQGQSQEFENSTDENESSASAESSEQTSVGLSNKDESSGTDSSSSESPVELVLATDGNAVRWNNVAAAVYEVTVAGSTVTTTDTFYSLENLTCGVYEVSVKAYLKLDRSFV